VHGTLTQSRIHQWSLTLAAKQDIKSVIFPSGSTRHPLDADIGDDVYYYPRLLGIVEPASARNADGAWWGLRYPGEASAPLVVYADADQARMVAATNWPPRDVQPEYAAQRLILKYSQQQPANTTLTYGAIVSEATGQDSWRQVLDDYRAWLDLHVVVTYPEWQWLGDGFLNVELQTFDSFNARALPAPSSNFPWVQMWGQMGPYAMGCCEPIQHIDNHYLPGLTKWVQARVAEGFHVGYYSAPNWTDLVAYALDQPPGILWLSDWLTFNRKAGANAFYVDVMGGNYVGEAEPVRQLFVNATIPQDALIEMPVDIYPVAALTSGSLAGDQTLCGAPYKAATSRTTFPRFGRYLLRDRLLYHGGSNTDGRFVGEAQWGVTTDGGLNAQCGYPAYCAKLGPALCNHGTELMSFSLGLKQDVTDWARANPVRDAIIAERARVRWFPRRPVYRDTDGLDLREIKPTDYITVTRFIDRDGRTLVASTNPLGIKGRHVRVGSQTLTLSARTVSIQEVS
jgi:hypothetical protein